MSWRSRAADAVGEAPYELEVVLQELLATHPDLLAGDQMNEDAPRRWLLVRREAGVPDYTAAPIAGRLTTWS